MLPQTIRTSLTDIGQRLDRNEPGRAISWFKGVRSAYLSALACIILAVTSGANILLWMKSAYTAEQVREMPFVKGFWRDDLRLDSGLLTLTPLVGME